MGNARQQLVVAEQEGVLVVIDTEDNRWLGAVQLDGDFVTVITGRAGRRPIIDVEDVDAVHVALQHADVAEV
jgi:hypothetical protein